MNTLDYLGNILAFSRFFNRVVSAVRHNNELSSWFDVSSGTGQGDIQGPPIFNVCINLAAQRIEMSKIITNGTVLQKSGTSFHKEINLLDVDYADDMALLDNSKDGPQETTHFYAHMPLRLA